jgi:hypothetical protein
MVFLRTNSCVGQEWSSEAFALFLSGYKSPLRPIPRHTIPQEFPLSTAGAVAINETLKAEELDSQDAPECDEWEDEAWWGEVISTVDNIECLSQRSSQRSLFSNQVDTQPDQTVKLFDSKYSRIPC